MQRRAGWVAAIAAAAWTMTGAAHAQGLGYGAVGVGSVQGFFETYGGLLVVAGGGEALIKGRGGAGGEVGILTNGSSALNFFSANGVYHVLPNRPRVRLSPFVLAGAGALGNSDGWEPAMTVGGGVDFWPRDRVGLRVEFRDYIRPDSRGTVQYPMLRVGIAFR